MSAYATTLDPLAAELLAMFRALGRLEGAAWLAGYWVGRSSAFATVLEHGGSAVAWTSEGPVVVELVEAAGDGQELTSAALCARSIDAGEMIRRVVRARFERHRDEFVDSMTALLARGLGIDPIAAREALADELVRALERPPEAHTETEGDHR